MARRITISNMTSVFTGTVKVPDGTVSAPSIYFASQPTMGFYKIASSNLGFAVGGINPIGLNSGSLKIASNKEIAWTNSADSGAGTGDTKLVRVGAAVLGCDSDFRLTTLGKGIFVKEGSNATMGVVTLSGGTGAATVYTTAFTASSRVFATHQNATGTLGTVRVTASSNLVSFTLSTGTADTSVVAWWLIQQA